MNKFLSIIVLAGVLFLSGCSSAKKATSTIVGGDYNATKNTTEYFVLPLGQVSLPGKWTKGQFVNSSRQQFFRNQDGVNVAIGFTRYDRYEFNKDGSLNGYDFVKAFYDWDSKYFISNGLECNIIESDVAGCFIVYRVFGNEFDTYFLIGEKNGNVSNFSINITDKWTEKEKVEFLKSIF